MDLKPAREYQIDRDAAMEICFHEAIVPQTYLDSVNKKTWGPGITDSSGHRVDRYINNPQPMDHILKVYLWLLDKYADDVRDAFGDFEITKGQFTAALSFHWNTGKIKKASWVGLFKAGEVMKASESFMSWRKPKQIIERRGKEHDLFFHDVWFNDGTVLYIPEVTSSMKPKWSSSYRRDIRADLDEAINLTSQQHMFKADGVPDKAPDLPEKESLLESTTALSAGGGAVATTLAALSDFNPWLAGLLIVIAAGILIWVLKERREKIAKYGI